MFAELLDIATKIGLAAILSGLVGAEREWSGQWAGLRTHMIIAVGAALFTDVSIAVAELHGGTSGPGDPGRIAAQIVTGIGFLGAGTIIQSRGGVHGLTTAAGIWVAAAIGLAVGAERYKEAAMTAVALLAILRMLKPLERRLLADRQTFVLRVDSDEGMTELSKVLQAAGIEPESMHFQRNRGRRTVKIICKKAGDVEEKMRELVKSNESLDFTK